MLKYILIQDLKSGITLFEVRGKDSLISDEHIITFGGIVSALPKFVQVSKIGGIDQISTIDRYCLFYKEDPINLAIIIDKDDSIDEWKEKIRVICVEFLNMFGKTFDPSETYRFQAFAPILRAIISKVKSEKKNTGQSRCGNCNTEWPLTCIRAFEKCRKDFIHNRVNLFYFQCPICKTWLNRVLCKKCRKSIPPFEKCLVCGIALEPPFEVCRNQL